MHGTVQGRDERHKAVLQKSMRILKNSLLHELTCLLTQSEVDLAFRAYLQPSAGTGQPPCNVLRGSARQPRKHLRSKLPHSSLTQIQPAREVPSHQHPKWFQKKTALGPKDAASIATTSRRKGPATLAKKQAITAAVEAACALSFVSQMWARSARNASAYADFSPAQQGLLRSHAPSVQGHSLIHAC